MKIKLFALLLVYASLFSACGAEGGNGDLSSRSSVEKENADQPAIVNTGKSADQAYEMLHVVFEGNPEQAAIKKLMAAVMTKYNIEENYENLNRCGSALLSMKKSSAIGVTEMQILKHMYQYGDAAQTFPSQAAISAMLLEQSN